MKKVLACLLFCTLTVSAEVTYKVRLARDSSAEKVVEMPAEQYVAAVLAGESSTFRSAEALQAMAVAARTYAARLRGRHAAEGYDFCSTTHCQRVATEQVTPRLITAARATAGELLWFEGKPAFTVYARNCGGRSEAGSVVWPELQTASYLRTHADPYCTRHGAAQWSWNAELSSIADALQTAHLQVPDNLQRVAVRERTASGRSRILLLQNNSQQIAISAGSFRFALGRALGWNTIRSEQYEVQYNHGRVYFRGRGQGHGVGLCQEGADEMGTEGFSYREILAFYYPGTAVGTTAKGMRWTRLGGEGVTLWTAAPDRDRPLLPQVEQLRNSVEQQTGLMAGEDINIRVYPDLDTFRNATGEPGWVAARSSVAGIDLQPLPVLAAKGSLQSTLRHEFLHVVIERAAMPGLPLVFREGLVEWLSHSHHGETRAFSTPESDLRQRQDFAKAGRAYAAAEGQVAGWVNRYGKAAVLGWLKRGLPLEVKNSIANSAATNSR